MFQLFFVLAVVAFAVFAFVVLGNGGEPSAAAPVFWVLVGVYLLATIIPSLAVQVRRFHDMNMSGWWVLLNFIPYIGGLIVCVMFCFDGTPGPNRFGDDPKGRQSAEPSAAFASRPAGGNTNSSSSASASDAIEQLQKLTKLFDSGAISKEEFERLKAGILKPRM
jgi:uncharacterized membrane protein YhaH (DUF805 family)